ncbi:MAG: DUF3050 domain-containing protein [Pirellulales bacterium]
MLEHPIYGDIRSPSALRIFMQHHVFAVWDFMSLLKTLQRAFCCVTLPWLPPVDPLASRLINEIVLGEETDAGEHGGFASHFELYHRSMVRFGASTAAIDQFLSVLRDGADRPTAYRRALIPPSVQHFVDHTFAAIEAGHLAQIASAFTFGREDLLPAVFQKIVERIDDETGGGLADFRYYLKRHIDLDGDEHGPAALRLVSKLCGDDGGRWEAASAAAVAALQSRKTFWDAIHAAILNAT